MSWLKREFIVEDPDKPMSLEPREDVRAKLKVNKDGEITDMIWITKKGEGGHGHIWNIDNDKTDGRLSTE